MNGSFRFGVMTSVVALVAALFTASPVAAAPRPRTGGLTGAVVGHSGTPLAAAAVRAYALPGQQRGCAALATATDPTLYSVVATTTTRTDGTFTLPLTTGYYRIGVTPVDLSVNSFGYYVRSVQPDGSNVTGYLGFAGDVAVPTGGASGLTIRLSVPSAITGHVADPDTAAPLAGLEVRAVPETIAQMAWTYPSTTTDATGNYALRGLPRYTPDPIPSTSVNEAARWGLVMVDPAGWHGGFIWWHTLLGDPAAGAPVSAVDASSGDADRSVTQYNGLALHGRVLGKVVNAKGRPVSGVEVKPWAAFPWPHVLTDAKGQFAVPSGWLLRFLDPAGTYRDAFYPGVENEDDAVLIDAAPGTQVTITMKMLADAARVSGNAWYAVGEPAAGVMVGHTVVRCDGSFSEGGFWPGAASMQFIPPIPDANATRTLHLTLAAGQKLDVGQVTLPSYIIDGEVIDETTGAPVAGARVDLMNTITWEEPHVIRYWADSGVQTAGTVTDDQGYFRLWLPDQPAGWPYLVVRDTQEPARFATQIYNEWPLVSDPDAVNGDPVTDESPMDDQGAWFEVFVAPAGVNVQVVDTQGQPQQDFGVTLLEFTGTGWEASAGAGTDENGWAHFGVQAGSTYRVRVDSPWGSTEWYQDASDADTATDVPATQGRYATVTVQFGP